MMVVVPIGQIERGRRLRETSEPQLAALIASIADVGLLNPITIYPRKNIVGGVAEDGFGLVAGAHRLEACQRMGWTEIPAQVVNLTELERQIAECDENLCGAVLTPSERARFTRRRKEAYEALHPETKQGGVGRGGKKVAESATISAERFTADTAEKTGKSERAVQVDAERGLKISELALAALHGTHLDKGVYLDRLKRMPEAAQLAIVERDLAEAKGNLRTAIGTDTRSKEARGLNFYETPVEAMRVLLALEDFSPLVWEPACGRGAISAQLEAAGYDVFNSDIVDRGCVDRHGELQGVMDFLQSRRTTMDDGVVGGPAGRPDIVTNPPYGESLNAFVAHALRVHKPNKMALLLNFNFAAGFDDPDRCFVMDEQPPAKVILFTRRLPMMHRDGWDGEKASSRMNTAWFVWERQWDGSYGFDDPRLKRRDWKDFENLPPRPPELPPAEKRKRARKVKADA